MWIRKHVHNEGMATPGATVGCDFSGVVEEVGPKVEKQWKKGDRIAGFVHGVNALEPEDGCFAEYVRREG
jgi:NADPH:quinone reductase-like Zn-dependent oxidoreductase